MIEVSPPPSLWKADSATQISTRNTGVLTIQGNSGGLTLIGGTASGNDLTFQSTSNSTKGSFFFDTNAELKTSWPDPAGGSANLLTWSQTTNITGSGNSIYLVSLAPTWTLNTATPGSFSHFHAGGSVTTGTTNNTLSAILPYMCNATYASAIDAIPYPTHVFSDNTITEQTAGTGEATATVPSLLSTPTFRANGASASLTYAQSIKASQASVYSKPAFNATGNSAQLTYRRTGLWVLDPSYTTSGSPRGTVTLDWNIGLDMDDQVITAQSGTVTVSLVAAIRSAITTGTNKYTLYATGDAPSVHAGSMTLGGTTAPSQALHVLGNGIMRGPASTLGATPAAVLTMGDNAYDFNNGLSLYTAIQVGSATAWLCSTDSTGDFLGALLFNFRPVIQSSPTNTTRTIGAWSALVYQPTFRLDASSGTPVYTVNGARSIYNNPTFSRSASSGTVVVTELTDVWTQPVINTGATVTTRRGLRFLNKSGSGTQTNSIAVDVSDQTVATLAAAVRSAIASGTGKWFLQSTGTADSALAGGLALGSSSATAGAGNLYIEGGSSTGYIDIGEFNTTTDASAPSDNRARLYVRDNGAGKEQLVVRFNTGAVQVLATEP